MQLKQIFVILSGETDANGFPDGFLRRGRVFRGQLDVPEDGGQVSGRSETRGFHASGSGWCQQVEKRITAQFWHEEKSKKLFQEAEQRLGFDSSRGKSHVGPERHRGGKEVAAGYRLGQGRRDIRLPPGTGNPTPAADKPLILKISETETFVSINV